MLVSLLLSVLGAVGAVAAFSAEASAGGACFPSGSRATSAMVAGFGAGVTKESDSGVVSISPHGTGVRFGFDAVLAVSVSAVSPSTSRRRLSAKLVASKFNGSSWPFGIWASSAA